jgi:hypothetical protein
LLLLSTGKAFAWGKMVIKQSAGFWILYLRIFFSLVFCFVFFSSPAYASTPILGDSDNELRVGGSGWSGGTVDADANIAALKNANINTYAYLIWHQDTDWTDLPAFLQKAEENDIDVWVYLVPPSEGCSDVTPYGCDFVTWGEKIAELSNQYPALKGWMIDDFFDNTDYFTAQYIGSMLAGARAVNPNLKFYAITYFGDVYDMKTLAADKIDGIVFPYSMYTEGFTDANRQDEIEQINFINDLLSSKRNITVFRYPWYTASSIGEYASFTKEFSTSGISTTLKFHITDSNTGETTTGYHLFQILVDNSVVYERDSNGVVDDPTAEVSVDISQYIAGKDKVNITARCIDKKGVSNFGLSYIIDGLVDPSWTYSKSGSWNGYNYSTAETPLSFVVMVYSQSPSGLQPRTYAYTYGTTKIALDFYEQGITDGVMQYALKKTQPYSTSFNGTRDAYAAYAAGECDNWQAKHPGWLWCDDFEAEHDLSVNYRDISTNNFAVSSDDKFMGDYSLKQHYNAGQVDAGWISWFYCDTLGNNYGNCQDEIYMRWYHKFEDGFEGIPPKMARITSIGPGWDKRFGVYYWMEQYNNEYLIVADVSTYSGWIPIIRTNFSYSNQNNIGRWTCHEMRVKQGSNGGYTYWAEGQKIAERNNTNLNGDYNFNNAMLDTYWNGGSPKAQNRYYDNFVISTERIGCIGTDSGQPAVKCTDADTDSSGSISNPEIKEYINRWLTGQVSISNLMNAIKKWKSPCN